MFVGFDYGTSNCAMAVLRKNTAEVLRLEGSSRFIPSTLYALERELIAEAVLQGISGTDLQQQFKSQRSGELQQAQRCRVHHGLPVGEQTSFVGQQAIQAYLDAPEEGFFIKSPKSFLGAGGFNSVQVAFFEDVVTLMMMEVKARAEQQLQTHITQTVIGKPVNFQGHQEHVSNQQALAILSNAAGRAGFKDVEFLYEPLAAGIDFETTLQQDQTVLVVDVGGGTTDCSVVKMGPSHIHKTDREDDFLGHSGVRVGGNDLDIHLSMQAIMPLFGLGSELKNGTPLPNKLLWDAVAVNDVAAQKHFNSKDCARQLGQFLLESKQPELIKRLQLMQSQQQSYQVVRSGELCKIALSDSAEQQVDLSYIEVGLELSVAQSLFAAAIQRPLSQVTELMQEAIQQSQVQPDLIYVTGGTAKSPVIHQAIQDLFPDKQIIVGDHFGSVTAGLTQWAGRLFK